MQRAKRIAAIAAAAASLAGGVSAVAQSRTDRVVAKIGDERLTVGDVEARLARVPAFRLRELGGTPDEIKARVVDEIVDLELLVAGARADKIDQRDDVKQRLDAVLINALGQRLQEEALRSAEVSDDAVRAYYDQNRERYAADQRVRIWQIVLASKDDADKLLKAIHGDKDWDKDPVGKWEDLAKKSSIDRSTAMTKGDLGWVRPDGSTAQKQVRVSPALFAAAAKLGDGQIAADAVQDGERWVVVSRRGTMNTPERTLEMETPTIRRMLARQQVQERMQKVLDELRTQYVKEIHLERLDDVTIDVAGGVGVERRPGSLPKTHRSEGPEEPQRDSDGELR